MALSPHVSAEQMEWFLSGRSDEAESNRILTHLAECDQCLALADEIWVDQPVGTAVLGLLELDEERARHIERKLVRQIHRSNLSGAVIRMGTQGFISVAISLLRPLFGSRAQSESEGANHV